MCSGWLRLRGPVLGAAQPPVIITENNIQFSNPALPPPPPWLLSAPHSIFGTLTHSTVHLINFIQNVICNIYQINGTDPSLPLHSSAREPILPAETKTTVNNFSSDSQKKNYFHVTWSWLLVFWHVNQWPINKGGTYVCGVLGAKNEGNPSRVLCPVKMKWAKLS